MAKHSSESLLSRHPAVSREYDNASARTGASGFVSGDVGLLAWQKDNDSVWLLTATPPTWVQVGVASSDASSVLLSVRKGSAGTITHGQPCYFSGWNASGWIEVELADADDAAKMPCGGLANGSITNAADGQLVISGTITDIDTSSFSVKDSLYVSTTEGILANTRPTGSSSSIQKVGTVLRSDASSGIVIVTGVGQANVLPNIAENYVWRGDSSGQPEAVTQGSLHTNAIHTDVSSEIYGLTLKSTPVAADVLTIEDSANGYAKRKVLISAVGGTGESLSVPLYLNGLNLLCDSPGRYCYIAPGTCRNDDDDDFIVASSQLTIDSEASAGANAIDTGSVAANTSYYVFVIYNPTTTTTAGLFSLSRTSPTLPSGYTKKRFLGYVRTDGDSDFIYITSYNVGNTKYIQLEEAVEIVSGGTETSWTDIDCSSYIPQDANSGEFLVRQGAASGSVFIRPNGTTRNWMYIYTASCVLRCGVDSSRYLEYRTISPGTAYIWILGYYENL